MANFQEANLSGANLEKAILASADLRGAFIIGTQLKNVELTHAMLTGAIYSDKETSSKIFEDLQALKFNYFGLDIHNRHTIFPDGFNPEKAGMLKIESIIQQVVESLRHAS